LGWICNCSTRILWTVPVNVHRLFLAMLPFSNQFQSLLNVTMDIDDVKNELTPFPKRNRCFLTWMLFYSKLDLLTFKLKWLHSILFSRYKYVLVKKLNQATLFVIIQSVSCSGINLTPTSDPFNVQRWTFTCYWVVLLMGYLFHLVPICTKHINIKVPLLATCFTSVSCLCSSEMSVDFQQTTRCRIPEDRILHNHQRKNL
jgi:hypothetical protein